MREHSEPITLNAAFLQEIKDDNYELHELLHRVAMILAHSGMWRRRKKAIAGILARLRDQIALHFALEEAFGYFDDPLHVTPQISRAVDALRSDHEMLFLDVCDLVEQAERVVYGESNGMRFGDLLERIDSFLRHLESHENREKALISQMLEEELNERADLESPVDLGSYLSMQSQGEESFASLDDGLTDTGNDAAPPMEAGGWSKRGTFIMSRETVGRPMEIMLVEDNLADARLAIEALKEGQVKHRMTLISDGHEAMEFLHREGKYSKVPRPDLILLDLGLPVKDGREVLTELKSDLELKDIPVVILTTSKTHEDILRSELLHVDSYMTKPVDMEQFLDVVRQLKRFWMSDVMLPSSV